MRTIRGAVQLLYYLGLNYFIFWDYNSPEGKIGILTLVMNVNNSVHSFENQRIADHLLSTAFQLLQNFSIRALMLQERMQRILKRIVQLDL